MAAEPICGLGVEDSAGFHDATGEVAAPPGGRARAPSSAPRSGWRLFRAAPPAGRRGPERPPRRIA